MGATFFNQIIVIYPEAYCLKNRGREQAFRHHQWPLGHPANQGGISLGFRDASLHKGGHFANAGFDFSNHLLSGLFLPQGFGEQAGFPFPAVWLEHGNI